MRKTGVLLAIVVAVGAGCVTYANKVRVEPGADFSKYETVEVEKLPALHDELELFGRITEWMERMGFRVDNKPKDLSKHLRVHFSFTGGRGDWGQKYLEALRVSVHDAQSGDVVCTGYFSEGPNIARPTGMRVNELFRHLSRRMGRELK